MSPTTPRSAAGSGPLTRLTGAWQAASQAGIARVERYYTDRMMFDRYRQVYAGAFARCPEAR